MKYISKKESDRLERCYNCTKKLYKMCVVYQKNCREIEKCIEKCTAYKRLKRTIRKETDKIKVAGLHEFLKYCNRQKFSGRLKLAFKILFKVT